MSEIYISHEIYVYSFINQGDSQFWYHRSVHRGLIEAI
nr:MAG TPA: hypothetical protein [Caudoviricetes sp.]